MLWLINVLEAFANIRSNAVRATLTMCIIAFGIMAMVGVLTSIDGIKYWMRSTFSTLGANTFVIQNVESNIRIGGKRKKKVQYLPISFQQARRLKDDIQDARLGIANVKAVGRFDAICTFGGKKTNNNIQLVGTDENFLTVESYTLAEGRALTTEDIQRNRKVAVIGHELKVKLFPQQSPLQQNIYVGQKRYKVIGLLNKKGTSFGRGGDKMVAIPVSTLQFDFPSANRSFDINVFVPNATGLRYAAENAYGFFRVIRKIKIREPMNFAIIMSDSFVSTLMESISILTISATLIAIITLFGAAVGLMNIMLVSVTERTQEIGLRKATGATPRQIMLLFLTEAITICQLGGLLGIALGTLIGLIVSYLLDTTFSIPWAWILLGIGVCFVVGILSGLYPARKAARLDPIEALRFE
jgi:putative ABC transport system permease protein